jgi:CspA family cold shock protein
MLADVNTATVAEWHDDEGWGVLHCPQTPGGCWVHFSAVAGSGYRALHPGDQVVFTFEQAYQDGYSFRAVEVRSPSEQPATAQLRREPGPAYHSTLTITRHDGTVLTDDEVRELRRRAGENDGD